MAIIRCQECGKELPSLDTKHTLKDCAEHHLKRYKAIMGILNYTGLNEELERRR